MIRRRRLSPRVALMIGVSALALILARGCGIVFFGPQEIERGTVEKIFEDDRFPRE